MKKWFAILLVVCLALSLCACQKAAKKEGDTVETVATSQKFTVTVVYADGSARDFQYESNYKYVGDVLKEEGLIEGKMGQYGLEISKVDGIKAVYDEDKAYWAVYEGEEYAMQGIDQTPVVDGGVYKLVYTPA